MTFDTLHPVVGGGNTYCGPGALAAIFCISPRAAAELIRGVTGKTKVFGVSNDAMLKSIKVLGATATEVPITVRVHHEDLRLEPGIYLIEAGHHYVAFNASTLEVCDNHTIYPRDLARYSRRRKLVKRAWRIS